MIDAAHAAFARRLIFCVSAAGFGAAAYVASQSGTLEAPPAAFALGAIMALIAFWQDWRLSGEAARFNAALAAARQSQELLDQIADLIASRKAARK